MKRAEEILQIKKQKLEEKRKLNQELINTEMLEVEKGLNTYERDLENNNGYITIPIIIKTDVVKNLLAENGYIIDRTCSDIDVNTTRIWIDKSLYEAKRYRSAMANLHCTDGAKVNKGLVDNLEGLNKARNQKNVRKEVIDDDRISFQESFKKLMEELNKNNVSGIYYR